MLYDQGQLAVSYLDALQATGRPEYERTARDTLDYVLRDLCDRDTGAFYCAEDADSLARPRLRQRRGGREP
jgi:uncharacterized protein YyaL (SSP411 family)